MSNVMSDILRLENTEAGLTGIIRSKADGYATDTHRLTHKFGTGEYRHWTADEDFTLGASGVNYTTSIRPSILNVEDALDAALGNGGYIVGAGVTGVPYYGDGIIENYIAYQGSAIYSEDGHVYFMGESGYTGIATQAGCRFVITPVPQGDTIAFVVANVNSAYYPTIGFTGIGGNNAELKIKAYGYGATTHLVLEANYGKLKLTTGDFSGGTCGVVLSGNDDDNVSYSIAASGKHRNLYVDEDGEVVQSESDNAQRYKTAGFTGVITATYFDTETYAACNYEIEGNHVHLHLPTVWGFSVDTTLRMSGIPAEARAIEATQAMCVVRDQAATTNTLRSARASMSTSDYIDFFPSLVDGSVVTFTSSFSVTGYKGFEAQTLTYRVN